jgi:hypothetical protein
MDVGTIVSWIQLAIWAIAVVAVVIRVQRGEAEVPSFLKNNPVIGIVIALGICGSLASLYLHYTHPRIVEVVVEKPVEKIVEKKVLVSQECPNPKQSQTKRDKSKDDAAQTPQRLDCGGGNCAVSTGQQGGITAGQINVTSVRSLTPEEKTQLTNDLKKKPARLPYGQWKVGRH